MYLADLHIHSTYSDGRMTIPEIVDLYGKRGFGAIAITDHLCESASVLGRAARILGRTLTRETLPDYLEEIEREARRAWHRYGMLVLPGMELTRNTFSNDRSAHVLSIGVADVWNVDEPVEELCRRIRARGGLAVAAHPVHTRKAEKQTYYLWDRREALRDSFDAWEVASGRHWFTEVEESGLPMIATSDLHRAEQIHAWKTVFEGERTRGELFAAIKAQDLDFVFYQATVEAPVPQRLETRRDRVWVPLTIS